MGEKHKAVTNNKRQAPTRKKKNQKKLNLDNEFFVASKSNQDNIITPFKPV